MNENYDTELCPYLESKRKGYILCMEDALDMQGLIDGYVNDRKVHVYCLEKGDNPNIDYHVVDSYDGIDYIVFNQYNSDYNGMKLTTPIRALNDLYKKQGIYCAINAEDALYNLYLENGETWEGLGLEKCTIPKDTLKMFKEECVRQRDWF